MADLDFYFNFPTNRAQTSKSSFLTVISWSIQLSIIIKKLHTAYHKVVLFIQCVPRKSTTFWAGYTWKPLCSYPGPLHSIGHHKIMKKGDVFSPCFVLFTDHVFFYYIIKGFFLVSRGRQAGKPRGIPGSNTAGGLQRVRALVLPGWVFLNEYPKPNRSIKRF